MLYRIGDYTLREMLLATGKIKIREIHDTDKAFEAAVNFIVPTHPEQGLVITCRDVTEAYHMRARSEQEARLAAIGQLAAGIAHDFNNILTVMMGTAQILDLRTDVPEAIREDLKNIYTQGRRASHLIRQVLDFSRKTIAEKTPVDLVPFLKETAKRLERTLPEIQIQLAINIEEAMVKANLMQLQQVITNLAVNARDAMPDGGILSIGLDRGQVDTENAPLPDMKPGAYLCWTMRDTGVGIPPDVVKRIFEPFFTTKAPGKGTGLGLAQVFGIVEQHGGKIDVESQKGKGTCFSLYLPETAQTQSEPEQPDIALVQGSEETVLLVEDDMGVRMIVCKFLENMNYQILEASNGQEAIDILKTRKDIDLILTDVVMPEMGGLKLVKHIRDTGRDMPVVMMSGYPLGEDREEIKKLRISGWLNKPLNMNALAQALQKAL